MPKRNWQTMDVLMKAVDNTFNLDCPTRSAFKTWTKAWPF